MDFEQSLDIWRNYGFLIQISILDQNFDFRLFERNLETDVGLTDKTINEFKKSIFPDSIDESETKYILYKSNVYYTYYIKETLFICQNSYFRSI